MDVRGTRTELNFPWPSRRGTPRCSKGTLVSRGVRHSDHGRHPCLHFSRLDITAEATPRRNSFSQSNP